MKLDPLLAPMLEIESLPILRGRSDMNTEAANLTAIFERISSKVITETDPKASEQLGHIASSLAVMIMSLVCYTRGKTPKLSSKAPTGNLIIQ
jgi:hypothetical protein